MKEVSVDNVIEVIAYIEAHLEEKLTLDLLADAMNYSKYHLHRMFTGTLGLTIHDYIQRRQLTEAAKLLVFSNKPIIEIALIAGYEGQQAFTAAFRALYKLPPAEYRARQAFYPLQLRFHLHKGAAKMEFSKSAIRFAEPADIPAWLELTRLVIDGYPYLDESEYLQNLEEAIREKRALILKGDSVAVGVMAFSYETGSIEFMGVHPQYRGRGIHGLFLDRLMEDLLPSREISITTYRQGDRADTGHRAELLQLGFAEKELMVEYGYPTQRFVCAPNS